VWISSKNQRGLELKIILPIENGEEPLLFHSKGEAEKHASKIDKSKWKAPVKVSTLAEFMGDTIEAMQDEGFDLAWQEIEH
jgi:hypothetical protein